MLHRRNSWCFILVLGMFGAPPLPEIFQKHCPVGCVCVWVFLTKAATRTIKDNKKQRHAYIYIYILYLNVNK